MKSLKFKIVALLLAVPLLLLFTTNTIIKGTEVLATIPVSSVSFAGEKNYLIDVAAEDNSLLLSTAVLPEAATNKSVTFSAEGVENTERAEVLLADAGDGSVRVTPLSCGTVRIVATADGGRTDSVQIVYYSSLPTDVVQTIDYYEKSEGDTFTIGAEAYAFLPQGSAGELFWKSSAPDVASVTDGRVTCKLTGRAVITVSSEAVVIDPSTGETQRGEVSASFVVSVDATQTQLGVSFGGEVTAEKPTMSEVSFPFSYDVAMLRSEYGGAFTLEYDEEEVASATLVMLTDAGEYGTARIDVSLRGEVALGASCDVWLCDASGGRITCVTVIKDHLTQSALVFSRTAFRTGSAVNLGSLSTDGEGTEGYVVVFTSDSPEVVSVTTVLSGGEWRCYATGHAEGTAQIGAQIYRADGVTRIPSAEPAPVTVTAVTPYKTLSFAENSQTYGLEKRLTVATHSFNAQGGRENAQLSLSLRGTDDAGVVAAVSPDDRKVVWTSSDPEIARVEGGAFAFGGKTGEVTLTAESAYNQLLGESVRASFTFRVVSGVNVSTYEQLMAASRNRWTAVLTQDIFLAPLLASSANFPDGGYRDYIEDCVTEMKTTAPHLYYSNLGHEEDAVIRYCVEFTADLYGNGHFIDAQHITVSARKNFGVAPFNGPLDLVRLHYSNASPQNAAVKAQDNIVFLVREAGISLTNVELKGCSDSSILNGEGQADLTNLDNCGTVLEIVGDNCSLTYSRVNNGRTCIRMFGSPAESTARVDAAPEQYRINGYIGNCILTNGREFILKIGSNQVLRTPFDEADITRVDANKDLPTNPERRYLYDEAGPYLRRADGSEYLLHDERDEEFYQNYVMTDLTLENSVFSGAGLFCIGFESNFAGLCLYRFDYSDTYSFCSKLGWQGIAGTSYPAVIRMRGEVRFYDWKQVDSVNSDTLITGSSDILDTVGLNLDVAELIGNYNGENAEKLTYMLEGEKYVNGAVAFYGGGKNYSYLDLSGVSRAFYPLTTFEVPLSMLGSRVNLIYLSAGAEPFRFMLYDADCALSPERQRVDIADNSAYSWVARQTI